MKKRHLAPIATSLPFQRKHLFPKLGNKMFKKLFLFIEYSMALFRVEVAIFDGDLHLPILLKLHTLNYSQYIHFILISISGDDCDIDQIDPKKADTEFFVYQCLNVEEVEKLLNESVERLYNTLQITPALAKMLLHQNNWKTQAIIDKFRDDASKVLTSARIYPTPISSGKSVSAYRSLMCPVCANTQLYDRFYNLSCSHSFCKDCWSMHFETQINQGGSLLAFSSLDFSNYAFRNLNTNRLHGTKLQCSGPGRFSIKTIDTSHIA